MRTGGETFSLYEDEEIFDSDVDKLFSSFFSWPVTESYGIIDLTFKNRYQRIRNSNIFHTRP